MASLLDVNGLPQMPVPVRQPGEVLVSRLVELLDGILVDEILDVYEWRLRVYSRYLIDSGLWAGPAQFVAALAALRTRPRDWKCTVPGLNVPDISTLPRPDIAALL